jgi:hypothetical protein
MVAQVQGPAPAHSVCPPSAAQKPLQHWPEDVQGWFASVQQKHPEPGPPEHGTTPPSAPTSKQPSPAQQAAAGEQAWLASAHAAGVAQVPASQTSVAVQHGTADEQLWPVGAHAPPAGRHAPAVAPGGTSQASPAQQSPLTVQVPPSPTHGETQTSPSQAPEQHWASVAHPAPTARHPPQKPSAQTPVQQSAGASQEAPTWAQVPGSPARQVGPVGPGGSMQEVPAQHAAGSAAQEPPAGTQAVTAAQRSTPSPPGTQGARLQHWSRNWQTPPSGMQHPGFVPSQPVGQPAVAPPKQRNTPFWSGLQTAFRPSQQFCEAFTSVEAPQMLPGGLQAPPLSQVWSAGSHATSCAPPVFTLQQAAVVSQ